MPEGNTTLVLRDGHVVVAGRAGDGGADGEVLGVDHAGLSAISAQEVQVAGLAVALGAVGGNDRRIVLVPVDEGLRRDVVVG